jgi:protein-L-isoaspartate(D-aspartate) O-methyltransferase
MALDQPEQARDRMVAEQLAGRGITDAAVLNAMRRVARHAFVAPELRDRAYDDTPLPIGERQTISQPYMVAAMTEALAVSPGERVLEVGTGSGYQAAILAELGAHVVTLERLPVLAERARAVLAQLGYQQRVRVEVGDGTLGWPPGAPYDAVVITAGAPRIPRPLVEQLSPRGRLLLPIGDMDVQQLVRVARGPEGFAEEYLGECRFVKLYGSWGWEES